MTVLPRIRVLMMQRDEGIKLMAWLSYYGQLFGFENLTILDNGSKDPFTLHLLAHAVRCGVTVRRDLADLADFHGKGLHFAAQFRAWDNGAPYDFALPVDCDEFLVVLDDEGISTDRICIMREFAYHTGEKRAFRIGCSLFNIPERPGWFALDTEFIKGFLPAGSVDVIDNGQHNPSSCLAPGYALTRFSYLHWHNHDFAEMQRRTKVKLTNSLIDPDDREALKRYAITPNLPGRHLVDILLEDEAHYLSRYEGMLHLFLPWARAASSLPVHLENAPILLSDGQMARPWSGLAYESRYDDVRGWAPGPLMHFLLYGWLEGRQF
ncbi:glycosyltransferase family 2 protein [Asaia prunellae]|uniref:glycosyltransferase family 2 protein n=1 Tax=Asaia prunellae TaxID=610245 RepID=UPI000A03E18C|nr:glycosyltransferase family 2 protein [Asaia prunellae]